MLGRISVPFLSMLILPLTTSLAHAACNYHIMHDIEGGVSFYVQITGRESGMSRTSPKMLSYGDEWEIPLRGGQYHVHLLDNKKKVLKCMGDLDFGKFPDGSEANFRIGLDDRAWFKQNGRNTQLASCAPCAPQGARQQFVAKQANRSRARFGITFHVCEEGIHIDSVTAGSPATQCFDPRTGERLFLDPGDHILSVNDEVPENQQHFLDLIFGSPQTMKFTIKDSRTGQRRMLTTELAD